MEKDVRWSKPQRGDGVVYVLQRGDAAHEIDQNTEENAADERARECERQQEAGSDAAVEPPKEQPAKRGMRRTASPTARAASSAGRTGATDERAYHSTARRAATKAGEGCNKVDEKRYGRILSGGLSV